MASDDRVSDLVGLPSVIVCKVLGYLPWKSKLSAVAAIPQWAGDLASGEAWPFFVNAYQKARRGLSNDLNELEVRDCIARYGRYFQRCKLVLEYDDVYMCHMDQTLLHLVLENCVLLHSLIVHFPDGLGFQILECLSDYRSILNTIPNKCPRTRHLSIHFIDYAPVDQKAGISEMFEMNEPDGVISKITAFDFSYIYPNNHSKAAFLSRFTNLRTLKTEAHLLTLETVLAMCRNGLKDLYLENNALTRDYSSPGALDIDWTFVADRYSHVKVHYIFKCSSLLPWNLKPNPLLYSLVFDSLFNSVTHFLLEAVGRCYGQSLRLFAQLSSEWSFMPYDDELDTESTYGAQLLTSCPRLEAFYTSLIISSSDVMTMADSGQITTVVVNSDELFYDIDYVQDQRTYLDKRMSLMLGAGWKALPKEEFVSYTRFLTSLDDERIKTC